MDSVIVSTEPGAVPITAAPEVQFVGGPPRVKEIKLEWPLEHSGRTYASVWLKRMTAREVAAFVEQVAATAKSNPDKTIRFPVFVDETGAPIPDAVLDALDDDDATTVYEAAGPFLPRRFQAMPGNSGSAGGGDADSAAISGS
jgi:hypothetical protein